MLLEGKKLLVYELNEVPERVLRMHVEREPESNIAKLLQSGTFVSTYAPDSGVLSPWVTWPTVHRGVNNEVHCIRDFGQDLQDVDKEYPPIWKLLAARGIKTGVFGSLHSSPLPTNANEFDFYLPDTFAQTAEAFPKELETFQNFNLSMVDKSGRNVQGSVSVNPAAKLIKQSRNLGIRPSTFLRVATQLLAERKNKLRRVRRRTTQIQLAFDIFVKQLKLHKPQYACFFTNHVASSMHRYWPATFTADYTEKQVSAEWVNQFADEIPFTMREADRQLGVLSQFVRENSGYALVVLSSMGQAAVDTKEIVKKQLYIKDLGIFMSALGVPVTAFSKRRAMLPRYVLDVDPGHAEVLRKNLADLRINGEPVTWEAHESSVFMVKMGHINLEDEKIAVALNGREINYRALGLVNETIEDETGSYAYHVPGGCLLIYDPQNQRSTKVESALPTTEFAPMILKNFGLDSPAYMR